MDGKILYNLKELDLKCLLEQYNPECTHCSEIGNLTRPSLSLRRAITLALVRKRLLEEHKYSLETCLMTYIKRRDSGEPYLESTPPHKNPPLKISISHSGSWIAFILSPQESPVTVDIENMTKKRPTAEIAQHAFSSEENAYIKNHGEIGFYALWSAKEAIAKLFQQDLVFALSLNIGEQLTLPQPNVITQSNIQVKNETICIQQRNHGSILETLAWKKQLD